MPDAILKYWNVLLARSDNNANTPFLSGKEYTLLAVIDELSKSDENPLVGSNILTAPCVAPAPG